MNCKKCKYIMIHDGMVYGCKKRMFSLHEEKPENEFNFFRFFYCGGYKENESQKL